MVMGATRVTGRPGVSSMIFRLKSRWEIASGRCRSLREDFSRTKMKALKKEGTNTAVVAPKVHAAVFALCQTLA